MKPTEPSLGQRIRRGAAWLLFGSFATRVQKFLFGVVLARLLVPADFGMVVTVAAMTGFAGMFVSAGMGQSLIRAKHADEGDFRSVFTMQLAFGCLVYIAFFSAAPSIADFFGDPAYSGLVRVSALLFLFRPFAAVRGALLSREMNFKRRSMIAVVAASATGIASVAMAWNGMGVWSLVFAGVLSGLLTNVLYAISTPLVLRLTWDLDAMRRHWRYGSKITVNDFLSYLSRESRNLIVSKLAGPTFLGLFNKAESQSRQPNDAMMPAAMQPVFRALSTVQDDLDQTRYIYCRAMTLLLVYTGPFYVGLWWVAEPYIEVIYGEKWVAAAEPMQILVLAGLFFCLHFPSARLLEAQNHLTREMAVLAVGLVLVVAAVSFGLRWGLGGVAWALLGTEIFTASALGLLAARSIELRAKAVCAAFAPGVILNAALFLVLGLGDAALRHGGTFGDPAYLLLMIATGGIFYGAAFLWSPLSALESEQERWRSQIGNLARFARSSRQ